MKKVKLELWRIKNHVQGYGVLLEPKHDIEETIYNFCNKNNVTYCFHKISLEEEPYTDGVYRESRGWNSGNGIKTSNDYKFGDYTKYVTIYYQEQ